MIPARRGQRFGFTVRINQLYLFLCGDFSDGKKRAFKFLFKSTRNFICILRCYRAQQGVILAAGKCVIDRVKSINGLQKSFRFCEMGILSANKRAPTLAFFNNMPQIRTQTVTGIDGGMNARLSGEKTAFPQMGFRYPDGP